MLTFLALRGSKTWEGGFRIWHCPQRLLCDLDGRLARCGGRGILEIPFSFLTNLKTTEVYSTYQLQRLTFPQAKFWIITRVDNNEGNTREKEGGTKSPDAVSLWLRSQPRYAVW